MNLVAPIEQSRSLTNNVFVLYAYRNFQRAAGDWQERINLRSCTVAWTLPILRLYNAGVSRDAAGLRKTATCSSTLQFLVSTSRNYGIFER
jgi:hypothetical protein